MAIRKGQDWGVAGALPDDGVAVHSDAEARVVVTQARRACTPVPVIGLLGGDLCRTLGGRGDEDRLRSPGAMTLSCDLGSVLLDGRLEFFVAHLVARRAWWRGRAFVAMNAAWLETWNLGPRAHPGDGLIDTYDARLPLGQRLAVRARLTQGAHVPHPAITEQRTPAVQVDLGTTLAVRLDGEVAGEARILSLRVEPDAFTVVV